MGEHHPLGMSGRARGVEQAGQGAGVEVQGCEAVRGGGQDRVEGIRAGGGLAAGQEDVPDTQPVPDRPERGPAVGIGDQDPAPESATTWRTSSGCSAAFTTFGTAPALKAPR